MNKTVIFTYFHARQVSVVFNISPSHANTNLSSRLFSYEQFSISKYSSILHALSHSE